MSEMVSITLDTKDLDQKLLALARQLKDKGPMMDEIGTYMVTSVKRNFSAGGRPRKWNPPALRSGKPLRDTGDLMGSIAHQVQGDAVLVGTNSIKAKLHHFGGVIRPKKVKALPVPIHKEAARAQKQYKSVRDIPDLTFIPRKGKPPLLVKTKGRKVKGGGFALKGISLEPWFVLKKSVKVDARPFLLMQPSDPKHINAIIKKHVEMNNVR